MSLNDWTESTLPVIGDDDRCRPGPFRPDVARTVFAWSEHYNYIIMRLWRVLAGVIAARKRCTPHFGKQGSTDLKAS